ncbi:MAG TPA: CoA transferase [Dehalococcoidia bacterium]|jgi:crotonobetainyl-CoA:carnitine CoA-transferase CaiB-like acyl-CoA transferase|nr:CoA transferase [Dehalococcoidia bacterium]
MSEHQEGALSVYRVLDLTDQKGAFCTKILADLGADVIKIERPEGDATRSIPPFAGDVPHIERSLYFLFRYANRRGVTLNLETADGKKIFERLVKKADVLVETFSPGYMAGLGLDYVALKKINPGLVMASITEFGQTGPYKDWKGSDIVNYAMSNTMITSGFGDGAPINLPGTPSCDAASLIAAISIITALYMRGDGGQGRYIDTSVHESSRLALYPWMLPMYSYNVNPGMPLPPPEGRLGTMIYPVYPCKDGFIRVVALTPRQWDGLVHVLGDPEVLKQPQWREFYYRIGNAADIFAVMLEFTMQYTMQELFEKGHEEGVPIVPIYNIEGFTNSPQTEARKFYSEMKHPVVGKFKYPGPPYKWSGTHCEAKRPAPTLGQHNEEIYCKELGLSKQDLAALRRAEAI